jgi:hypothetical protein
MADDGYIYFRCVEIRQPVGTFYVASMNFSQVTLIACSDLRRMQDRDTEGYLGLPRLRSGRPLGILKKPDTF